MFTYVLLVVTLIEINVQELNLKLHVRILEVILFNTRKVETLKKSKVQRKEYWLRKKIIVNSCKTLFSQ